MSEEKGLSLAKLFGGLFVLVGLILIVIGAMHAFGIPELQNIPELQQLAGYLGSVGATMEFVYGILAIVLGIGLIKEEEWAAGGTFILLIIIIVELASYVWYMYSSVGTALPMTAWLALSVVAISVLIMIYLIWASGWK